MATANFAPMNFDMPLIAGGIGDDYEERKKEWEEVNDTEYSEDLYNEDMQFVAEEAEEDLKDFNAGLDHFKITIEPGYYQGWQWQVEWQDEYLDYDQIFADDFTDEDADYYYNETAEEVRAEVKKEEAKVRHYLEELKKMGFTELYKYAQFSNGEAIYERVS